MQHRFRREFGVRMGLNMCCQIWQRRVELSVMDSGESAASLLRELRRRKGHTLRFAATELGVAPSQLSRMERGERPVGDEAAQRLARYYSVSVDDIVVSQGQLPADVVQILQAHPSEIARLRDKYAG